jgi:hypothetical protein
MVKIYTDQNLYGSKFILVKIYTVKIDTLYIKEAYSHCVHCQSVLWRSHVTFEQLQLRNYTVNRSWSRQSRSRYGSGSDGSCVSSS